MSKGSIRSIGGLFDETCEGPKMIESLFVRSCALAKHQDGPLLKEREEYLQYLATRGKQRAQLRKSAMDLLNIIRVMGLISLRNVDERELREAGDSWAQEEEPHRLKRGNRTSAHRFSNTARDWFRFRGVLIRPPEPTCHFDYALNEFAQAMQSRLAPSTIQNRLPLASTTVL